MLNRVQIERVWKPVNKRNTILVKPIFRDTICNEATIGSYDIICLIHLFFFSFTTNGDSNLIVIIIITIAIIIIITCLISSEDT